MICAHKPSKSKVDATRRSLGERAGEAVPSDTHSWLWPRLVEMIFDAADTPMEARSQVVFGRF